MKERRLALSGGRQLVIRAMKKSDAAGVESLYRRLDDDDLYKRFFSGRPPPDAFVEKMAAAAEGDGFGVVAISTGAGRAERLVAEASFSPLPDGNAELGITVDPSARGWLGPYMLDLLVAEAAGRGIPNLEAEVLATNRQMQALLESRGSAVTGHSDCPATVRLRIGTAGRSAAWTARHDGPRLLVEAAGGRWRTMEPARRAGFEVLACPGVHRKLTRCPALAGVPCPLAVAADVIVDAIRGEDGRVLLRVHRQLHPAVPVCVDAGLRGAPGAAETAQEAGADGAAGVIYSDMDEAEVLRLLRRAARRGNEAEEEQREKEEV